MIMKTIMLLISLTFLCMSPMKHAAAQSTEAAQLLLNVEKLAQFKQILKDMKKGYQILDGGYNTVKDIAEGNFSIHKVFLDGLMQVSPTVRKYKRIVDIIDFQIILIREYKNAFERFKRDENFAPEELAYLGRIYDNLFKQSLRNMDELTNVITANKLRMSDDERLKAIDTIYEDMQDKLIFLRHFNNNTTVLAVQRAKEKNDVKTIGQTYGITH